VPHGTPAKQLQVTITAWTLEVRDRVTGQVYLSGDLARGVVPRECQWWVADSQDRDALHAPACSLLLVKQNLELLARGGWRHADTVWPSLFLDQPEVACDDTHRDYTDLPPQVLEAHRLQAAREQAVSALEVGERDELHALEEAEERRRETRAARLAAMMP
ncbi:CS domain-containing protein, partial [Haematococcus lacustris]